MSEPAPVGFEDFFRAHFGTLGRALYLLTSNAGEAEDLAQEAMARVFERWDRVAAMDSPEGYLYRTAMNLHRKGLRRLAVRARRTPAATRPDPMAGAEARAEVHRVLQSLTREQREAVVLVDWVGLTGEEAGAILGIDAASVRGRLHRARATLRERFGGSDA